MSNKKIYQRKLQSYTEAKQQLAQELGGFSYWAEPRIIAHLNNGRRILEKYNHGRPIHEQITKPSLPWAYSRGGFKIIDFTSDAAVVEYRTHANTIATFDFPLTWISLSVWNFNKLFREELKKTVKAEKLKQEKAAKEKLQKEARELANQIEKLKRELETARAKHTKTLERL